MTDTPWYKQFWPWFVISIPATTVVACMYTISLAIRTSDSLTVSGDSGVDVITEQHLADEDRASLYGLAADVVLDDSNGVLTVRLNNFEQVPTKIRLEFSHPTMAAKDHNIELYPTPSDDGLVFIGHQQVTLDDRWYVVLQQTRSWRLSGTWTPGAGQVHLSARGAR